MYFSPHFSSSEPPLQDSSTSSGSEFEEELPVPPTPPLFNGRALTNGVVPHRAQDEELLIHREAKTEEKWTGREEEIAEEADIYEAYNDNNRSFTKENFDSLIDTYNNKQEEVRPTSPLSDQENLAGVNVKQLVSSVPCKVMV